jgi:hypothetical protein
MPVITIGSDNYEVYITVAEADTYMNGDTLLSASWSLLPLIDKQRLIVSSSRYFNTLCWLGVKSLLTQPLEWPRNGVSGVVDGVTPQSILDGVALFAGMLSTDTSQLTGFGDTDRTKKLVAGSVSIEYFSKGQAQSVFSRVEGLVKKYMCSAGSNSIYGGINTSKSSYSWPCIEGYNVW